MIIPYRFITSLFYPATLGAALSWWTQALEARIRPQGGALAPSIWVLIFALWFLCAYGAWFVRLAKLKPTNYTGSMFASDLLDTAVIFVVFGALGLMTGGFRPENRFWIYLCSILVVISASVAGRKLHLIAIVGAVLGGIAMALPLTPLSLNLILSVVDPVILGVLWLLLILYQIFAVKWTEAAS
jgi:hypothetical protein